MTVDAFIPAHLDVPLSNGDDAYGRSYPDAPCVICGSPTRAHGRTICAGCVTNDCVIASGTCNCPWGDS